MRRWIFGIVIISMLSILIVGCTTVGAVNLPVNLNNDENQVKNIDDNKINDEEKVNQDKERVNQDKEVNVELDVDEQTDNKNKIESEKKSVIIESKIHYSGDSSKKRVALTFDDGPESIYTFQILDILNEYNIKATFFVIGQSAEKYPEVLKDIYEKGHEIGNHSWSHKYLPKLSEQGIEKEILMTEEVITNIIGDYSPIFRPAYGAIKKQGIEQINSLGYNVVNWSVDTKDWAGTAGEQMMEYVKHQLTPGGIVLMHNGGNPKSVKNTMDILPTLIEWIIEQGYEFVTVSEMLY